MFNSLLLLVILLFSAPVFAGDYVVILHGIARSSSSMGDIEEYLEGQNYQVKNIDYPSTDYKVEELVDNVHKQILEAGFEADKRVHFVAYSMGTLITRMLMKQYRPENLGRVVFIAPPSEGSEVADFVKDNILYKEIYGAAGQQLVTDENGIHNEIKNGEKIDYELGIIAGDRSIDPISSAVIPGKDDGKVALEKTKIKGMKDFVVVNSSHTFIITFDDTMKQIDYFLKNGKFDK